MSKQKTFDFDERLLQGIPVDHDPDAGTMDVTIQLGVARNARIKVKPTASIYFTGIGLELTLAALPFDSLRRIANFIHEVMDEYEKKMK